jgi:hypothetical protein
MERCSHGVCAGFLLDNVLKLVNALALWSGQGRAIFQLHKASESLSLRIMVHSQCGRVETAEEVGEADWARMATL